MNPKHQMRLFIAVTVPSEIKHEVSDWIDEIKPHLPFRKWVHQEDLHITLQFLGDTPPDRVPHITQALHEISAASNPLKLSVGSLGIFGRPSQPSALWAGVGGDLEGLHRLQKRVAGALTTLGFTSEERTFHPHLTLARTYTGAAPFDRDKLRDFPVPASPLLEWTFKEITLYQSHLDKRPMYEVISVT